MTQIDRIASLAKNSKIKMITTDMDGTLLNAQSLATDEIVSALEILRDNGIMTFLCSGRTLGMVRHFCIDLPVMPIAISCNGALIYDFSEEKILSAMEIENSVANEFSQFAKENSLDLLIYRADGAVFYPENSKRIEIFRKYNEILRGKGRAEIPLFLLSENRDLFEKSRLCKMLFTAHVENDFPQILDFVKKYQNLEATVSLEGVLDVMAVNSTKGFALKFLAEKFEIPLSQTFAIGDNQNDISMFEVAAKSACLVNGDSLAKQAAGFVTARTCDENGWLDAIEWGLRQSP